MSELLFYVLLVLGMVSWGESWISAKIVAKMASPEVLMFYRFTATWISFVPVMIYLKQTFKINLKGIIFCLLCSVFLIGYNEMFFGGLVNGLASVGGILVTTLIPVATFVIVSLAALRIPSLKDSAGLLIGMCGAMIIIRIWDTNLNQLFDSGNMYFLIAAFLWGVLTYLGAYVKRYTNVFTYSFYLYLFTTILDFGLIQIKGLSMAVPQTATFWFNIFMLSVSATTFGSTIFFIAAMRIGSKKTSSFVYLVPVNALVMSWLILHETITLNIVIGGLLAVGAVYLINMQKKEKTQ